MVPMRTVFFISTSVTKPSKIPANFVSSLIAQDQ